MTVPEFPMTPLTPKSLITFPWLEILSFREVKLDEAAVLHFTYSKYSDLTSRRDRCGCKPTKEDVKRCFMLEFDRAAFIIASTATQEEMFQLVRQYSHSDQLAYISVKTSFQSIGTTVYKEHVVWGNTEVKYKLLKKGILTRIYTPMVIIQGLKEAGVFSNVIKSARAAASESQRNQSSEGGKSTNGTSAMSLTTESIKYQAAARKMLEAAGAGSGSGSDHPMAVPP